MKKIPASYAKSACDLLAPWFPELTPSRLVEALQARQQVPATSPGPVGKLLTVKQVAERLGVCRNTVFNMLRANQLPRVRCGRKATRIPESALAHLATATSIPPQN